MNALNQAALRRAHDPAFLQRYFAGQGLDICGADDSLTSFAKWFPRTRSVTPWRKSLADMQDVPGVDEHSFDFVHADQRLQHLANPRKALARWLDLVRPGGYVVFTVPDEDHLSRAENVRFTIHKPEYLGSAAHNVLEMVQAFSRVVSCERLAIIQSNYNKDAAVGEQAIEVVLRKRDVPGLQDLLMRATRSQSADECLRNCREAIATYPYRFQAYHRAILLLQRWNLIAEMDEVLSQAISRLPGEWNPKLYQMLHYIKSERISEGFQMREAMFAQTPWQRRTTVQPPANTPSWTGQLLDGKRIAIWSEYGLGDEIFFLRFARVLREQCGAAHVTVVCQDALTELFKASGEADDVVSVGAVEQMPAHDYWVYPHAIPAYLPLDSSNLPQSVPYLRVSEPAILPGRPDALKVGIVFKGAPTHENDHARSLKSLSVMDSLFSLQDVDFYSLQKGQGAEEAADYASRLANFYDLGPGLGTLAETAKAVKALDVLLTVDTSVAHVGGALGVPTWLLLPFYSDWRWHYERSDSPWYPSMRLFRQDFGADWHQVIARVYGTLLGAKLEKQRR